MRTARDYSVPLSFLRGAESLRWSAVDRLLALALTIYEASLCPGCGQDQHESMDDDLQDEWTTMQPVRCGGCTALARAAERDGERDHPGALRYVVGMREGWQARKAARVAARAAKANAEE